MRNGEIGKFSPLHRVDVSWMANLSSMAQAYFAILRRKTIQTVVIMGSKFVKGSWAIFADCALSRIVCFKKE
jgi:hypothetical protein